MEEELKNKKFGQKLVILLVICTFIGTIMIVFGCYSLLKHNNEKQTDNNESNQTLDNTEKEDNIDNNKTNKSSTFQYNNGQSYGISYVNGYAKIEKESDCEFGTCSPDDSNDIVYFYVTSTESEEFKKHINDKYPSDYTGEKAIQLGCLIDETISYYNAADDFYDSSNTGVDDKDNPDNYNKTFTLNKDVTSKIVNSSKDKPIILKLEKFKLSNGGAAFSCYSDFAGIEVVD